MGGSAIVGWEDADRASRFAYLLLRDAGEHPQVARRFDISRALLQDRGYMVREAESPAESSVLARLMGLIVLGDWVRYYRAVLDETDPTPVALIESLKQRLENHGDD